MRCSDGEGILIDVRCSEGEGALVDDVDEVAVPVVFGRRPSSRWLSMGVVVSTSVME